MIICIAHRKDLDGLVSHAIVRRYALQQSLGIEHHLVSYEDIGRELNELRVSRHNLIVVADLGYNPTIPVEVVRELSEINTLVWIDHHDWSSGRELLMAGFKFIHSEELCAAELAWKYFLPRDRVAREIASLAHSHDFCEAGELAWKLYDVISSGYNKLKFIDSLARGETWSEEFQAAYERYQGAKERAYSFMEEHLIEGSVGGYSYAIALSPKYLSSTLAGLYLQGRGKDFVVAVYPDGKLSFRRNSPSVNLARVAQLFNGGGREAAAGGRLELEVKKENFKRVSGEIVGKIRENIEILTQ